MFIKFDKFVLYKAMERQNEQCSPKSHGVNPFLHNHPYMEGIVRAIYCNIETYAMI